MAWITPKTNWQDGDYFDKDDYNRIIGNVDYLYNLYIMVGCPPFTEYDMGTAVSSYSTTVWDYRYFNNIQQNVIKMMEHFQSIWDDPIEYYAHYPDTIFCNAEELNYVEGNCIYLYGKLQNLIAGIRKIPFRLGQYKTRI